MNNEPTFSNYKEKQNYYREKYNNRGTTIWVSKMIGKDGKVVKAGSTYEKDGGLFNTKRARKAKDNVSNM